VNQDQLVALARSSPAGLAFADNYDLETGRSSYQLPPHIDLLNTSTRDLALGEMRAAGYRGIIFTVPPRHGKSFQVSQYTPAWYLGSFPENHVALASYEADFAASWGRKAREVLEAHGPSLFGVEVDPSNRAANNWRVRRMNVRGRPKYGSMVTAGIGGPLTGRGVHLLIIDDPVKNHIEAHSKTKRKAVWDWWTSTAATRLEPGAFIIIIMTRWHEDDLAGRLLSNQESSGWNFMHVNLPAIAGDDDPIGRQPGEPLWAERYDADALEAIRLGLGSYVWNSLYQGRPVAREGGMFNPDHLRVVDARPSNVKRVVRRWDLAATEGDGDYTAGVRIERLEDGTFCIADVKRGQLSPAKVEELVKRTAEEDGPNVPIRFEQERGGAGKALVDGFKRMLRGYKVSGKQDTGDKEVRAHGLSAKAEAGGVILLRGDWNGDFLEEASVFPHGTNDDQIDAASGGYNDLHKGGAAVVW
jgi:predicted phage terminase large subunit-like protein